MCSVCECECECECVWVWVCVSVSERESEWKSVHVFLVFCGFKHSETNFLFPKPEGSDPVWFFNRLKLLSGRNKQNMKFCRNKICRFLTAAGCTRKAFYTHTPPKLDQKNRDNVLTSEAPINICTAHWVAKTFVLRTKNICTAHWAAKTFVLRTKNISKNICTAYQKHLFWMPKTFVLLTKTFVLLLLYFLNFRHTKSYFLIFWHTFSYFLILSYTFSFFFKLWHTFTYILKFWHTFLHFLYF